jgi:hypothetical protein
MAFDGDQIDHFLQARWSSRTDRDASFGSGSAASLFVDILRREAFWQRSLQKAFFNS